MSSPVTHPSPAGADRDDSPFVRSAMVLYAAVVYLLFLVVFTYAIGWVEGLVVPRGIDDGTPTPVVTAVLIDLGLLTVFALQHSVMARPAFKRWWTRIVPPPVERTTYVLFATAALALVLWQWRPLPDVVWEIGPTWARLVVYVVSFTGWGMLLLSTFLIDHFDLFGLRQAARHRAGRPPSAPRFQTPLLYRVVRHPLYLGFLVAFWAAPTMTAGHLLFAGVTTAYILLAIRLEERDLLDHLGDDYAHYRDRVPMILPTGRRSS